MLQGYTCTFPEWQCFKRSLKLDSEEGNSEAGKKESTFCGK